MEDKKNNEKNNKLGRRSFLKKSAATSLGAASLAVGGSSILNGASDNETEKIKRHKFAFSIREYDKMEEIYEIDPNYKRMRQRDTLYSRAAWDPQFGMIDGEGQGKFLAFKGKEDFLAPNPAQESGEPGFGLPEHALKHAAYAGMMETTGLSAGGVRSDGPFYDWERFCNPKNKKYKFKSKKEAAQYIKRASRFFGADDTGIAPFDERWIYSKWYSMNVKFKSLGIEPYRKDAVLEDDAVFPFEVKSVIVTAFEMDKEALRAPYMLSDASAGLAYAKMVENGHKMSVFLNNLGYKAAPAGNDTSLNVPTALQAGLGENSRMGTLIHPTIGSGVRIAKIYTDLELEEDKPITFGVQEFCRKCKKCADACPSQSLSWDEEPSMMPTNDSVSSHPGVKRWYQNNEKCFTQWEKLGASCGICLSVCPYNKPENWVHDIAKTIVGLPIGRDIARIMDDSFGYGKPDPIRNVEDFWNGKNLK